MSNKTIPPERQTTYYLGMGLAAVGLLLFLSTFVSGCAHFGDFSNFEGRARSEMGTAIAGMICMGIGQFMMRIGRFGTAGSGVKLDPEQGRRDLEPFSRQAGGMLSDALDEARVDLPGPDRGAGLPFDEQLRRLDGLKRDGLITEQEYAEAKMRLLEKIGR